jgi:KTSC domain
MTRIPVTSSNVKSVGWENGTLEVEFHNGVYRYHNVPASKYAAILAEDKRPGGSIGTHFAKHIRPHHGFTKLS